MHDSTMKRLGLHAATAVALAMALGAMPAQAAMSATPHSDGVHVIEMPKHVTQFQAPIVYTLPLQLLAYHVAIQRGTDVDQPRNLAKSLTVE